MTDGPNPERPARRGVEDLTARKAGALPPAPDEDDHFEVVKVDYEISPTTWISEFTRKHPDLRLEIWNAALLTPRHIIGEFVIFGQGDRSPAIDWTDEIRRCADVLKVDRVEVLPRFITYRVVSHQPPLFKLAAEYGLLLRFPRVISNGVMTCEIIARRSQVRGFVVAIRANGAKARILSLRPDSLRSSRLALTPIQRDILYRAVGAGYFEVPRRVTLTHLSKLLSRSKSSVSEELAIIERKVVENAIRLEM